MIALIHAHPYPQHSRANRALLSAAAGIPGVMVRDLYTLYPDFHIDARAEQQVLEQCSTVVLQHPMHWYHVPALLSLWMEKTLALGWAYGHAADGTTVHALQGKRLIWAVTTGEGAHSYGDDATPGHRLDQVATPLRLTAAFCGMEWQPPQVVHGAARLDDQALMQAAQDYRERLEQELAGPDRHRLHEAGAGATQGG